MEERIFGLSQNDRCRFAFQPAKQNGILNPLLKENEAAPRKWLQTFLSRIPKSICWNTTELKFFLRGKSVHS
jgi:hypothetical protein